MFDSIMVDVETTGTDPSHSHVIQIAAVRFNLADKTIDTESMFNRCLYQSVANRYWDESTRQWWARQKPEVLENILGRAESPDTVISELAIFIGETQSLTPMRFWAKPLSFDWPFVASYFKQFGYEMPLKYWRAVDLNSYILGRGHSDPQAFAKNFEFTGEKHNALHDVIHQIHLAFEA